MNSLITYWVAGCVMIGVVMAAGSITCPDDEVPDPSRVVTSVAVWPALVTWAVLSPPKPTSCKRAKP